MLVPSRHCSCPRHRSGASSPCPVPEAPHIRRCPVHFRATICFHPHSGSCNSRNNAHLISYCPLLPFRLVHRDSIYGHLRSEQDNKDAVPKSPPNPYRTKKATAHNTTETEPALKIHLHVAVNHNPNTAVEATLPRLIEMSACRITKS